MPYDKKAADRKYYLKNRDRERQKAREYYRENAEIIKARTRKWYNDHKNDEDYKIRKKEQTRRHYLNNRDERLEWHRQYWEKGRLELINFLGGKCVRCGFNDYRALQIDHIYGGGTREIGRYGYLKDPRKLLEKIKQEKDKYQLLCANCNWIKRYENKENATKRLT